MWQRRDSARTHLKAVDGRQTGQRVVSVDVHRARAAHALATGAPEGQVGIDLVIDLDERIENHWSAMIEIDFKYIDRRVDVFVGIPAIDSEALDARSIFQCWPVFAFADFGIRWKGKLGHFRNLLDCW